MGYARNIGRVGGLAVALGIGAAVTGVCGTAWADEPSGSTTNSGGGQAKADGADAAGTAGPSAADGDTKPGSTRPSRAATDVAMRVRMSDGAHFGPRRSKAKTQSEPKSDAVTGDFAESSRDDQSVQAPTAAPDTPPAVQASAVERPGKPATASQSKSSLSVAKSVARALRAADRTIADPPATPEPIDGAVADLADPQTPATTGLATQTDSVADAAPAAKSTTRAVSATFAAAAANSNAAAPLAQPLGELVDALTMLGLAFSRTFFNQTPSLSYGQTPDSLQDDGTIVGDLHPKDPDSRVLTYTATDPAHGDVVVHPDGTFTYTPDAGYTGPDRFEVTVSDEFGNGFHVHGLGGLVDLVTFGFFDLDGHSRTQRVDVGLASEVLVPSLPQATDFQFLPDNRILIAQKTGQIRIYQNGGLLDAPLVVLPVSTNGESGLQGIAVDPQFATNGYIYVAYTTTDHHERLSRLTVTGNTVDLATAETVLLQLTDTSGDNHHGGAITIGPDGRLYWGIGDNSVGQNAQNLGNLRGKVLRLNRDGSVPQDNPFVNTPGARPEIYAYGLRNPYRIATAPGGQLLVADVGELAYEEVNRLTRGANYGWPQQEGTCNGCGSVNPIHAYPHGGGAAISSVLVYTGTEFGPRYQNAVFIADFIQGWVKVLTCSADYSSCSGESMFDSNAGRTIQMLQGPDGDIYRLTYQGRLSRLGKIGSTPTVV
jgi:aldose sugar dehydrogenase